MGNIAERHKLILDKIKKDGYVKVQELSIELGVSEVTIRKDLKHLEDRKLLYRTHGSASTINSITVDRHIDEKEKVQIEEKERIAKAASNLLEPNDKIIIASGTTLLAFANQININFPLTVITSSVKVSLTLCYDPNIDIVQLGGTIRKNSVSVIGHYAEEMLSTLSFDKLFLGVDGLDFTNGLTTSDLSEAYINKKMIDASREIIVLTDSTKFGKTGFCKICELDKIHQIVTDVNAPNHMISMIEDSGIKVTLV